jgi:hypothetical protein
VEALGNGAEEGGGEQWQVALTDGRSASSPLSFADALPFCAFLVQVVTIQAATGKVFCILFSFVLALCPFLVF